MFSCRPTDARVYRVLLRRVFRKLGPPQKNTVDAHIGGRQLNIACVWLPALSMALGNQAEVAQDSPLREFEQ